MVEVSQLYGEPVERTAHALSRDSDFADLLIGPNFRVGQAPPVGHASSGEIDETISPLEGEKRARMVNHRHRERASTSQDQSGTRGDGRASLHRCDRDPGPRRAVPRPVRSRRRLVTGAATYVRFIMPEHSHSAPEVPWQSCR
jgi:hypothetical protein